MKKSALLILILFFLWGNAFLQGKAFGEIFNRVVAIVNADVVTLYELNTRMTEMTGMTPEALKRKSESQYLETRKKFLEMLIEEKIASEKIRELKIKVPQKEGGCNHRKGQGGQQSDPGRPGCCAQRARAEL